MKHDVVERCVLCSATPSSCSVYLPPLLRERPPVGVWHSGAARSPESFSGRRRHRSTNYVGAGRSGRRAPGAAGVTDDLLCAPHRETSNAIFRQNLAINLATIGPPGKASDRRRQMEEWPERRHPTATPPRRRSRCRPPLVISGSRIHR